MLVASLISENLPFPIYTIYELHMWVTAAQSKQNKLHVADHYRQKARNRLPQIANLHKLHGIIDTDSPMSDPQTFECLENLSLIYIKAKEVALLSEKNSTEITSSQQVKG